MIGDSRRVSYRDKGKTFGLLFPDDDRDVSLAIKDNSAEVMRLNMRYLGNGEWAYNERILNDKIDIVYGEAEKMLIILGVDNPAVALEAEAAFGVGTMDDGSILIVSQEPSTDFSTGRQF